MASYPITPENQIRIQKNWEAICDDLVVKVVSKRLITTDVITATQCEDILQEPTCLEQNQKLLNLLLTGDNQKFDQLVSCLQEDYGWLGSRLLNTPVTEEDKQKLIRSVLETCSIPQQPACFVGRDEDIKKITDIFLKDMRRVAVIKSFGGQGKTALATVIGHNFVSKWGIRSIMADMKNVSFADDIPLSLLLALKSSAGLSSDGTNVNHLITKSCQEISSYGKKMLIILDNCESALEDNTQSHFYTLLQRLVTYCNNAYILCTTRRTIQLPNEEVPIHNLGSLTADESCDVLQSYSQNLCCEDGKRLGAKCSFVALLLHILGYLLRQGHRAIDLIEELASKTVFGLKPSPLMPKHLNAETCINLSYERLCLEMQESVQILSLFPTTFNADDAFKLLSKHQISLTIFDCITCLKTLCDASFLGYDAASGTYIMHSVIQAFAQEQASKENMDNFQQMFMIYMEHRINEMYAFVETENVRDATKLFEKDKDNYLTCIDIFESMRPVSKEVTCSIAKKLAFSLRQIGRLVDSLRCFKLVLDTTTEHGEQSDYFELAFLYYNIGYLEGELLNVSAAVECLSKAKDMYEKQNGRCNYKQYCKCCYYLNLQLQESEENYDRCLDILNIVFDKAVAHHDLSIKYLAQAGIAEIKAFQGEEEAVMSTLHDILSANPATDGKKDGVSLDALKDAGIALSDIGKKEESLSLYRRAVALAEDCCGEHHDTAMVLKYMSSVMNDTGDTGGAIGALRRALSIREKALGEYTEVTADTAHELARFLSAQGNHAEALSTYQRVIRIKEQVPGESHGTASTLYCIGQEMIVLGNADGAVDVLRRALAMNEKILGEYHEQTAVTIHELARAISEQGNHAEALSTYQRALRIQEQVLGESRGTAITLHNIGHEMVEMDNADGALDVLRRALAMKEKILGEYHESTAVTMHELACAISAQGNHAEALSTYQRALRTQEQVLGESRSTANTLYSMGQEMMEMGNAGGAVDVLRRALAMEEKILGEYHEQTAVTIHILARAISAQGNHAEALSTYRRALRILEQVLGESCSTANTLYSMGHEMIEMGNADGAVDVLRRAVAMEEKILGEYHESTAATIHELAHAISAQRNHAGALSTYQRALRIKEEVLGESRSTACTLHNMGFELIAMGNADGAVDVLRRAVAMIEKILGEYHEQTAVTIHVLARAISAQGNHEKALSTFQRALCILEQVLGESRSTASTLYSMGQEMIEMGNADGAVDVLRRALAMEENILGEYHKQTAVTIHKLALAISAQGNHEEALSTFQRALRIKEQVLGESRSTANTLYCIGLEMMEMGNADGAVDVLRRAVAMSEKILGEYHEQTADTIHELARALSEQGNHEEALSTYQRALRILEQVLGESRSTAITMHGIGCEMMEMGNADGAVDVLRSALAMEEKILGEYHEQTAATICELARAISAQGKHAEALSTYQRALRIKEEVLGECFSTANTLHCIGN